MIHSDAASRRQSTRRERVPPNEALQLTGAGRRAAPS
jgi:hypothetical protein